MGINEKIKQQKFSSEAEKALVNINYTYSYFNGLINTAFKEYNISIQQFNVLRILKGSDPKPVSVNDITDRMVDKMSNASRLVDKLKAKGLVEKSPCSYDRRQTDVSITQKGKLTLTQLNEVSAAIINDHSHVSEEDLKQLNETLDKFRKE
jgi:DNA-binding MarR family transcriptional regulator